MTNLIEKVAELRELEERATSDWKHRRDGGSFNVRSKIIVGNAIFASEYQPNATCDSACDDAELAVSLRNAAPRMLDALGKIQAGDAEVFDALIDCLESSHGGTEYEDIELSAMRRYRDLARLMEDDHAT